jgi:hypothetical protein
MLQLALGLPPRLILDSKCGVDLGELGNPLRSISVDISIGETDSVFNDLISKPKIAGREDYGLYIRIIQAIARNDFERDPFAFCSPEPEHGWNVLTFLLNRIGVFLCGPGSIVWMYEFEDVSPFNFVRLVLEHILKVRIRELDRSIRSDEREDLWSKLDDCPVLRVGSGRDFASDMKTRVPLFMESHANLNLLTKRQYARMRTHPHSRTVGCVIQICRS